MNSEYRKIIGLVPNGVKHNFNTQNDVHSYIGNKLRIYELYKGKADSLRFWSRLVLSACVVIVPAMMYVLVWKGEISTKMAIMLSAFILALIFFFFNLYMGKNLERYDSTAESAEEVLKKFCDSVKALYPKNNGGEGVGVVRCPVLLPSMIEKTLEIEATNILRMQDKVLDLCRKNIEKKGSCFDELTVACYTLGSFNESFFNTWNAATYLCIIDRPKKSFFDQAKARIAGQKA